MNKYGRMILSREDRQLLLNSQTVESYPELIPVLKKHMKITSIEDLDNLSENIKNIFKYAIKNIIKDASKEWVQAYKVVDLGNTETKCSLCGTRNRYICYIQNLYTDKRLNVGTECIKKFPDIKSGNIQKEKQELIDLQKHNKRRVNLGLKFPNLEEDISDIESRLENSPIVLPNTIVSDIKEQITRLHELSEEYFTAGARNSVIDKIDLWYKRLLSRRDAMNNYIDKNISMPFICTNSLKNWIQTMYKDSDVIIKAIQEDKGFIKNRTIKFFWENRFLTKHETELKESLTGKYLTLNSFENDQSYFTVSINKFAVQFRTSLSQMMKCVYIEDNSCKLHFNKIISYLNIVNSTDNDMEIEYLVNFAFGSTKISLGYNEKDDIYYFEDNSKRPHRRAEIDFEMLKKDLKQPVLIGSFTAVKKMLLEKANSSNWYDLSDRR